MPTSRWGVGSTPVACKASPAAPPPASPFLTFIEVALIPIAGTTHLWHTFVWLQRCKCVCVWGVGSSRAEAWLCAAPAPTDKSMQSPLPSSSPWLALLALHSAWLHLPLCTPC